MGRRKVLYMLTATDKAEYQKRTAHGKRGERREEHASDGGEMLAVFDPTVAKCPEGLRSPLVAGAAAAAAGGVGALMKGFSASHDGTVTVSLGPSGALAYSAANQSPLVPRLFGAVNDIFCLFQGNIENIANLKQHYGLSKTANEVTILIEAYRTLRDRGPVPASQVVRDLSGKFAFILYDTLSKSTFVAALQRPECRTLMAASPSSGASTRRTTSCSLTMLGYSRPAAATRSRHSLKVTTTTERHLIHSCLHLQK
uniref:DUF3700 domain-containing protein n=1 Tax=Setaria italica TaxID=4555 RepID=K4AE27_SETIT